MRITNKIKIGTILLVVILAVFALAMLQTRVWADDMEVATSGDGLDCFAERCGWCANTSTCQCLPESVNCLYSQNVLMPYINIGASGIEDSDLRIFFPPCGDEYPYPPDPLEGMDFVDEKAPDLFVILRPRPTTDTSQSYLDPLTALEYVKNAPAYASLGTPLKVHRVDRPGSDSTKWIIQDFHKALRVNETPTTFNLDYTAGVLGITGNEHSTPNNAGDILIHTQAIKDFVASVCGPGITCVDKLYQTGIIQPCVDNDYACFERRMQKYVIAHEAGHTTMLRLEPDRKTGGYHYAMGTGWVMDASAYTVTKGTTVTWKIPFQHSTADKPVVK